MSKRRSMDNQAPNVRLGHAEPGRNVVAAIAIVLLTLLVADVLTGARLREIDARASRKSLDLLAEDSWLNVYAGNTPVADRTNCGHREPRTLGRAALRRDEANGVQDRVRVSALRDCGRARSPGGD
jgi:hypothetical protein